MGWLWGGRNNQSDPAKSLDDDLKQFLNEQQPRPYVPADPPPTAEEKITTIPQSSEQAVPPSNESLEEKALPRESLFQDGRYKHIWKTYVPQNEITIATSTPVERVLEAKKERRQSIHKAALENCAFEEDIQQNCFKGGSWADKMKGRMTMCHEETKAFNRCYTLQAKFLQALGYMTSATSSDEHEEKIQMHADRLYHRMMDYEAAVDEATRNNQPIPPLSSLFNPDRPAPSLEQMALPKSMEDKMKKPLHEYPPHERELAARAALQEAKLTDLHAEDLFSYTVTMNEDRKARQAWLTRTFGEAIGKFLIPDPPKAPSVRPYGLQELDRDVWQEEGAQSPSTQPQVQEYKGLSKRG